MAKDKGRTRKILSGGAYIDKDGNRHEWSKLHAYKPAKITDDNWMEYGMPADDETNESRIMNKKLIRLTEQDLHRIVKESVRRIIKEDGEHHIFYDPQGDGDDECEEWDEAGLNIYDFSMVEDAEIADFHSSPKGYIIYHDGEEFGEAWYDRPSRCYRGVSDDDMFGGYKRGFEGANLNGIFMDIMDKASDAILNPEDEDEDW